MVPDCAKVNLTHFHEIVRMIHLDGFVEGDFLKYSRKTFSVSANQSHGTRAFHLIEWCSKFTKSTESVERIRFLNSNE